MRKPDAVCFRDKAEEAAVAVETPWPTLLDQFETRFIVAVQEHVCHATSRVLVGEFERLRAKPLHTDNRDQGIRHNAADGGVGLDVFEPAHIIANSIKARTLDRPRV